MEAIKSEDSLWLLRCKNERCRKVFDYWGRLRPTRPIHCTHCGKVSFYGVADFTRHESEE